jgi:hypothetical protein
MLRTLLIKEWREKALIAVFGSGVMVVFLVAFLSFGDNPDLRELIPATFLIFFFPFIGVMLGAGAFESEFRNGSWAYLLSRPVRKETIWLAKLTALLSIMAGLWLVFLGLLAVVPGLAEVVGGFRLPTTIGEAGLLFLPLVLLTSVFYFSIAFSLSILSERQLSLVFGSFFIGFALQGFLTYFAFQAGGRGALARHGWYPGLEAYALALVLSSLAFFCASLLTFRKVDFSQPKKKAGSLTMYSAVFLALAWIMAAAWPMVRPGPKEEIRFGIAIEGGEAFFSTTKGLFRYDIPGDKLRKIARWGTEYPDYVIGGGKVLYVAGSSEHETPPLRVMNSDGSGKTLLVGDAQNAFPAAGNIHSYLLSPDGKTVVVGVMKREGQPLRAPKNSLWSVRTDGTGSKKLPPLPAALDGQGDISSWLHLYAWLKSSDTLLLSKHSSDGAAMSLWTYDLSTGACARLFENPRPFACLMSPVRDIALIIFRREIEGPVEVQLLGISTAERSSLMKIEKPGISVWFSVRRPVWNREGDRFAFFVGRDRVDATPAVYDLKERRLVRPDIVRVTESEEHSPSLGWIGGGKLILGVPQERALKILDMGLAVERTIPVPASIEANFAVWPANDVVLLMDFQKNAVWRLDLKTEKWKKIW